MKELLPSTKILGTKITTASKLEILEYIFNSIEKKNQKSYVVTPNPEILVYATRSRAYQEVLNKATVSLPDGIGVLLAGKMLKNGIKTRIAGIDLMWELVSECAKRGLSIGLLGGRDAVAERVAHCLREKYPDLIVNFVGEEWPNMNKDSRLKIKRNKEDNFNSESINHKSLVINHIDILFVAFGAPKQEEWIAANLPNIDASVAMGVGGAFDYISGKVPRAPEVLRKIGMEWAFRLARQPWRAKRQLALLVFVAKVLKEKFSDSNVSSLT
ncbi:MAG: WecB/TagA/CpsF family glycosyltransferase [Candidatus Saccharibacteria bacterium]|nr:WecB/TagA/CpsF family glycosyltransferase [Candidatus Saccharibacteria bacterium]